MINSTGEPAFPWFGHTGWSPSSGITMRDWFAGHAMCTMFYPAIMDAMRTDEDINCDKIADLAYKIADAMLIKRAKDGSIK